MVSSFVGVRDRAVGVVVGFGDDGAGFGDLRGEQVDGDAQMIEFGVSWVAVVDEVVEDAGPRLSVSTRAAPTAPWRQLFGTA